jgi:hypothetical protein
MATPFQTTGYTGDPKVTAAVGNIINAGSTLAAQKFPQYTADVAKQYANYVPQLVAAQTPYQINAAQGMADLQGYVPQFTTQALQYAQQAAAPIQNNAVGAADINKYMSPYINNVANAAMQNINETNAQQQQQVLGNAISKGAFGGDRAGIAQAQLARQQNLANNATLANIYNTGYGTALGEANVQQTAANQNQLYNRQLANAAAAQFQNLGTTSQNAQLQQLQAQYNMGAAMQGQRQNELSAGYQQYLNANQSPYNQLNWYANLISGAPAALGGQTVATIPQPNTVSQLGGLATTLAGTSFGGLFGGNTTGATGAKRGGAIRPGFASGGRPRYADAGAVPVSADPVEAYNQYVNAGRQRTNLADLNALYTKMLNAQRGNATQGVSSAAAVQNPLAAYPALPVSGFTPEQAAAINATASNTPTSIASTPGQTGSASTVQKIGAAAGVLGALAKLFGGGDKGKSSGETFNKAGSKTQSASDKQEELNNQAENVADERILLQDDFEKNKISRDDYVAKAAELDRKLDGLVSKGAVVEKREETNNADAAAAIREERKMTPSGVSPVSKQPDVNENGTPQQQQQGLESLRNRENASLDQGVAPAIMTADASNGVLPVSAVQAENAVQFAQNNGLINASKQDLEAAGLNQDAVRAVLDYQQSPSAVQSLNAGEMAMQPSATSGAGETDPAAMSAYQRYINLGFTPEEARTAAAANTSVADKQTALPGQAAIENAKTPQVDPSQALSSAMEKISGQQSSAMSQIDKSYQDAIGKLGEAPQPNFTGVSYNTRDWLLNPNWQPTYDRKGNRTNNPDSNEIQAMINWGQANGIPFTPSNESDWANKILNIPSPKYEAWQTANTQINTQFDDIRKQTEEQYQKAQEDAQNQINKMYGDTGQNLDNAYQGSIDRLQDINTSTLGQTPTIENVMQYEAALPTTWEDQAQYGTTGSLGDFTTGDYGQNYNTPSVDTSSYVPPVVDIPPPPPPIEVTPIDTTPTTTETTSSSSSSVPPAEERRGGRIHEYPSHYYHGGFVRRPRRALGGPNVPQAGVHPISMDYGLNTQDYMKQLAQSQMGSGVAPVTGGQEALASTYLLGNG